MKVIFFNLLHTGDKRKYHITRDVKKLDKIYVWIHPSVLEKKYRLWLFQFMLSRKLKFDKNKYYVVFSNYFEKKKDKKQILLELFPNIEQVTLQNTMLENSMKYLSLKSRMDRFLIITDQEISKDVLLSYIDYFKYVDILDLEKHTNTHFYHVVQEINEEYGSNISFVFTHDLTNYSIYVIFNTSTLSGYKKNSKAYVLDITKDGEDKYSLEYALFIENKQEFLDWEDYSSRKLGKCINLIKEEFRNG